MGDTRGLLSRWAAGILAQFSPREIEPLRLGPAVMRGTQLGAVEQIFKYAARLLQLAATLEQKRIAQSRFCAGVPGRDRRVFMLGLIERSLRLERARVQQ